MSPQGCGEHAPVQSASKFIDEFCTTLHGALQRIINQIEHILADCLITMNAKLFTNAGFKVILFG